MFLHASSLAVVLPSAAGSDDLRGGLSGEGLVLPTGKAVLGVPSVGFDSVGGATAIVSLRFEIAVAVVGEGAGLRVGHADVVGLRAGIVVPVLGGDR